MIFFVMKELLAQTDKISKDDLLIFLYVHILMILKKLNPQ